MQLSVDSVVDILDDVEVLDVVDRKMNHVDEVVGLVMGSTNGKGLDFK